MKIPEGSECKHVADVLNNDLSNKQILSITQTEKSRYRNSQFPNQEYIVSGTKIKRIYARSKKIIWVLETPDDHEIYMVTFLAIHGHWLYKEGNCTRTIFQLNDRIVYYDDRDNKGTLQVCLNINELENVYKNIGPDLLSDPPYNEYYSSIKNPRIKNKTISSYLLDQKYYSGIGNIYRSEILYYTGIHPSKKLCELTNSEIEVLYKMSIYILKYSYQIGGVSVMSYIDPNGEKGKYIPVIYGRETTLLGHKVTSMIEEDRKVYYSPDIQK